MSTPGGSVAGLLLVFGLVACAPTAPPAVESAQPAPSSDPQAVELLVDPGLAPDLTPTGGGWRITGAPGFDEALATAVTSTSGRPVDVSPIALSSDLVGFRLRSAASSATLWYSLVEGRVVESAEILPGWTGGISFTAAGEPYLEQLLGGEIVRTRGDRANLSPLGDAARRAALLPLNPVAPDPGRSVDCAVARCVALTFDDGPSEWTYPILQTLAAAGSRATFFIRGTSVAGREDVLAATSTAGHQIGNHSQQHLRLSQLSRAEVDQEIAATAELLAPYPGNGSAVFRPPYGDYDQQVLDAAAAAGYATIMWNLDPLDYRTTDPQAIAQRVMAGTGRGAVVLSHDTLPATAAAYREVIPQLRAAGFELVTVDQLLGPSSPGQLRGGYQSRP